MVESEGLASTRLAHMIKASGKPGFTLLDPFCGSGAIGEALNGLVKSRWYAPMRTTDPS